MLHPVLAQVRSQIAKEDLSLPQAAQEIGVTVQSLVRHLESEYVRSDSLAKYRLWLEKRPAGFGNGLAEKRAKHKTPEIVQRTLTDPDPVGPHPRMQPPAKRHRVVDIFSGCGGLSLGFDRFGDGAYFETALALDLEDPMIRVFNDNHPSPGPEPELPRGRQADVTDFLNEAEIQAFYLDHLARSGQDQTLVEELKRVSKYNLEEVRANLHCLDRKFLKQLNTLRLEPEFVRMYRKLGAKALGQTSVVAFHRALKLPITALGAPRLETVLWADDGPAAPQLDCLTLELDRRAILRACRRAHKLWKEEVKKLRAQAAGNGKGQLSSSAERIQGFVDLITSESTAEIRSAWIKWKACRESLRTLVFGNDEVQRCLQHLYNQGRQVSVLLGGPPCQGFSRIGRGKIRSLREQSVHAHHDEDSGDSRNQLLDQYVLFVSALAPRLFLFENVRGFQAVVRIGERKFDADEMLAEAIKNIAAPRLSYRVGSQIVIASEHLVPQERERYLMAGLRSDLSEEHLSEVLDESVGPQWCIQLPRYPSIPLENVLEGLPEPAAAKEGAGGADGTGEVRIAGFRGGAESSEATDYLRKWICPVDGTVTDSHVARRPRADDAAFFDLMGPGKRWMDYRCDETRTLSQLKAFVARVKRAIAHTPTLTQKLAVTAREVQELEQLLDGSLSLRLLLESIPPLPGETEHHLLAVNYLKKKEGQHGDWLARMDPARPSKTMVSHMAKDTYAYVHPTRPRTLSVREAARIQTFPDDYRFRSVGLVDGFRMIGNAVPPLLSVQFAKHVARVLWAAEQRREGAQVVQLRVRARTTAAL